MFLNVVTRAFYPHNASLHIVTISVRIFELSFADKNEIVYYIPLNIIAVCFFFNIFEYTRM